MYSGGGIDADEKVEKLAIEPEKGEQEAQGDTISNLPKGNLIKLINFNFILPLFLQ